MRHSEKAVMSTTTLPTVTPRTGDESRDALTPVFNCVLLDDNDHSYDYVIDMLQSLFLISHAEAVRHAVEVDTTGRTIVVTAELPVASFARDQIHAYGPDWRNTECKGSMSAIVEPASHGGGQAA